MKSIVLSTETPGAQGQPPKVTVWLLLLRGDHEMNEVKVGKVPGLKGFRFVIEEEILEYFGSKPGYLGPVGMKKPVRRPCAPCCSCRIPNAPTTPTYG